MTPEARSAGQEAENALLLPQLRPIVKRLNLIWVAGGGALLILAS